MLKEKKSLLLSLLLSFLLSTPVFAKDNLLKIASSKNQEVFFKVTIPQRCMFGDFDAIRQDLAYSNNAKLLISIMKDGEEETEKVKELYAEFNTEIEREEAFKLRDQIYQEGYPLVFKDALNTDGLYVVRICKDSSLTNSCLEKKKQDINEVLKIYENPEPNYEAPDRVYFTQVLVVNKNNIYVFDNDLSEKNINKLQNEVKKYNLTVSEPTLKDLVLLNSKALRPIQAVAAVTLIKEQKAKPERSGIEVRIPVFDPVKCGQQ